MSTEKSVKLEAPGSAEKPAVFLLDDMPAQEDAFGPHKRIATAIHHLITTETGGKAIALIGTWGGGKSTVINLLKTSAKEKHEGQSDLEIFVFDAWSHEGDPLRRTFLEKIITFFEERKWISKDKWDKRLAQLSRRYKETTTTSTPQLTKLGSVCGLLLFVVAIGLAMLGGGSDIFWWDFAGFVLTLLPPGIFLYIWWHKRNKLPPNQRGDADDMLSYLANKQVEKTKTATIEESEPTSVEFQSWFCELAQEALTGNRKILLAIDNLDRIDPGDALKLWAAMRTFVDFSDSEIPSWASKLWVLVAFDEDGIKRLWKKEAADQTLATTFLDKTFQIRFRVPAPLLSNWRDFLMQQLKKAFPNGKDDDFYKICRIYAILNAEKRSPTPRDMKVFVNQIGAVSRTAPEQIPIPQQALYALLIEQGWDPIKELPEPQRLQSYLGTDWKENSASLFYSMPREKAIQVLLGEQVEKAMADGKPELLNRTEMAYIVDRILEQRLPSWRGNEPYMIGRAAYALTAPCISKTLTGQSANARLLEEMQTVTKWPQLDKESGMGISVLLKQANDGEITKNLLQTLSESSPITGNTQIETRDFSQWVIGIKAILDWLITSGQEKLISDNFKIAKSPQEYLIIISTLTNNDWRELWKYFRPACDPGEVVKLLNEAITSGTLNAVQEATIEVMLNVDCPWPWGEFIGLSSRLQNAQQILPEEIGRNIRILLRLRKFVPFADQEFPKLIQSGWLFIKLFLTKTANNDEATASAILFALLYDSEATSGLNQAVVISGRQITPQNGRNEYRNWVANPNQQKSLVDALFTQALALQCVDELLTKRIADGVARPTFDAVLQAFAKQENCFNLFSPISIVNHFSTIRTAIDAEAVIQLVKASMEQSTLEEELVKAEFSIENCGLYRQALHVKRSTRLLGKIIESLKSLSKDNWTQALNGSGDLIPLMADLVKWETPLGIGHQLQDALNEFAGKLFSEKIPDHITPEICRLLLSALTADQRSVFKKNIRDKVIAANSTIAKLTVVFPDAISDCEVLVGRVDEFVREGLRKMLDRGDAIEYEWMQKILQSCNQLLAQCPPETKQDFVDRVKDLDVEKLNDDCKRFLSEIRRTCGIPADPGKATVE
jgi:KAP family P-loop domain